MKPIISVIIPHFNRPVLLAEAVASIRASSFRAFEIIVVDDVSNDSDWLLVQAMESSDLRVFRRLDGIKGPSRCRNIGIEQAKGTYVIFLDSDDCMAPWCLEQRFAEVEAKSEAAFVVFPVQLFQNKPGDMDVFWNTMDNGLPAVERFARSDPPWQTSSPIWRTSVLKALGGFNEAVFYGDDSELHLRALLSNLQWHQCPHVSSDIFIRRSDKPRITNTNSADLVDSRRTRLREGTRYLKSQVRFAAILELWEGQYFVEAEFLLFNHPDPTESIQQILRDWSRDYHLSPFLRTLVYCYFSSTLLCRGRSFLALRIIRRCILPFLPRHYLA